MDFDDAKENIQPLAQGRNASILHASLKSESAQELQAQRKELEKEIHNYVGDDPLSVWYTYIEWIEQSFPSGGKESGLQEVLSKCLAEFESDDRYKQDRRMIKLYIKFIDSHKDPAECYHQLFSAGIGTMVADFYIAWAYCYDLIGNTRKADEIFLRGIACRAQPLEELQEARQHFGFSVAQRLMYKDDDPIRQESNRQLHERRKTLTTLKGYSRKKVIGSIRTGSVVKSMLPGIIKTDLPSSSCERGNKQVQIFKDENDKPTINTEPSIDSTIAHESGKSIVRSIIDAARHQENQKEPGPWNKAHTYRKKKLFDESTVINELGFEIHEDGVDESSQNIKTSCVPPIIIPNSEIKFDKPFIYPENFCAKSKPIKNWLTPVTTEEMPCKNSIPKYNKCKLYPRPNVEFQPEELKAYNILMKRGIQNEFTKERNVFWGNGPKYNMRLYPHFVTRSLPQTIDAIDVLYIPEKLPGLQVAFDEIYNKEENTERQFEEILALRIQRNNTITKTTDMDETVCVTSEKIGTRKSFFPIRQSLAPSTFKDFNKMAIMAEQNEKVTMDELCSAPICSMGTKIVKEDFVTKESIRNQSASQREISEKLKAESTTYSKTIPAPYHVFSENKLLDEAQSKIELKSNLAAKKLCSNEISLKPFEIFVDESSVKNKSHSLTTKSTTADGNDFHFKAPALPAANSNLAAPVSTKLPFDIYVDENLAQKNTNSILNMDSSCTGGGFDPEETCSTQTFNIFLKAQSVSTPKAVIKSQPERQFGNILKDVTSPSIPEQKDGQNLATVDNPNMAGATSLAVYSPPRQQLSTILETSEHGSTQGTHTTGATTKSTLSSPEIDIECQVQFATNAATIHPYPVLETVKELSCEISATAEKMLNSMKIDHFTNISTKIKENNLETPGAIRLEHKCTSERLGFSIFEDSIKKDPKQVGDFSRLENNEDTATGSAFKAIPPIRFQDDKTETIPKMLLITQQDKFQDDKTETISKIMFDQLVPTQFQEDKTETIPKMLLDAPPPIKFPEDKTETVSEFILAPPELKTFNDKKIVLDVTNKENNQQHENNNKDDSFEFFGQTPPKTTKHLVRPHMERGCHIRFASGNRTPLTFDHKRFCDKDTPEMHTKKSSLFEEAVQCNAKSKHSNSSKNNLKDSFFSDLSLFEDKQPALVQNPVKPKSKSIFRDSFIPDFSLIENSQATQENQHKTINESIHPEFSLIKNSQPSPTKMAQAKALQMSISDFFYVPETQSNDSIIKSSQPMEHVNPFFKQSKNSTVQKNLSKTSTTENQAENNEQQRRNYNHIPCSQTTKEDGIKLQNIYNDSYVNDLSQVKKTLPLPNFEEISMMHPNKNNSSLRFINESLKQNTEYQRNYNEKSSSTKKNKLNFLKTDVLADKKSSIRENKNSNGSDDDNCFEFNCATELFAPNISVIKNSTWLPNHGCSELENIKQLTLLQEKSLHIKSEQDSLNSQTSLSNPNNDQQSFRTADSNILKQNLIKKSLCSNDLSIALSASERPAIKSMPKDTHSSPMSTVHSSKPNEPDNCEYSIYYKQTSKTPKPQVHVWDDSDALSNSTENFYIHSEHDLNQTHQVIENICIDPNVNPFNIDLKNAFLEQNDVINFVESLPTCKLVGHIQRIKHSSKIDINGAVFDIIKLVGEGGYGTVFCGREMSSGKLVAMKQEKPPNFWEYYICLEVQERIRADEMLQAYMSIDYALIGNNSSILVSNFSQYGSLITVCNKIKKHTFKNVDEYVVMLLASELLEIMDHLHAVNIIHADIKADNFLLMKKLTYPLTERHLQLIDFGVSIDMKLFKEGQTFSFVDKDSSFKCPEMREGRQWTYQLDLYGLAGVFHALLFGKYMDIAKNARGFWMHKTHVPRYLNKNLWDEIFKTLLNVRDCNSMPNLQDLRALLKKELEEKDKYVLKMVNEFNRALMN